MENMPLDIHAHVCDGFLRGDADYLGKRVGRRRLNEDRNDGGEGDPDQKIGTLFSEYFVDDVLGACREDEACEAVDEHENQTGGQ